MLFKKANISIKLPIAIINHKTMPKWYQKKVLCIPIIKKNFCSMFKVAVLIKVLSSEIYNIA